MQALRSLFFVVPRGFAFFLGMFTLLNLLGERLIRRFDANIWWIDLRMIRPSIAFLVLSAAAAAMIAFAVRPPQAGWRRTTSLAMIGLLLIAAIVNSAMFFKLRWTGAIGGGGAPIPFSIVMALVLSSIAFQLLRPRREQAVSRRELLIGIAAAAFCAAGFPVAQMAFFGQTSYARPADAIVVFGARAYADGRPSDALADRVRTACQLYHNGTAPTLIFSGGPGDGTVSEAESMRRLAMQLGVPDRAIVLDDAGLNTAATVHNACAAAAADRGERLIAVSHAYHLPRVKMTFWRAGRDVYTVPAQETYVLRKMPYLMAREVVAFWAYYLSPILHSKER